MAQSLVPQAVARLFALAQEAMTPLQVATFIGEPAGGDIPAKYVSVAYAGEDRAGVTGSRERNPHSEHWAESFVVWCCASTGSGGQNAAAQMAETEELFALVAARFAQDRTLNGLLVGGGNVELGSFEWSFEDAGEVATVFFEMIVTVKFGA